MEAILIKNKIYTKVEKLTAEQLLLVSDFLSWIEKAFPNKQIVVSPKEQTKIVDGQRDMTAIFDLQKLFQETHLDSTIVSDVIFEREDRL